MSEQPTEAKPLKLHHRAMQVIPGWMEAWSVKIPCADLRSMPYCPPAKDVLPDLDRRFKAAFQQDEQIRDDLLAACEEVNNYLNDSDEPGEHTVRIARNIVAAIARAKGDTE